MKHTFRRFTVLDALLIAALVALPVWALVRNIGTDGKAVAEVSHDGRLVGTWPLDRDAIVTLDCGRPGNVKLEIRDGRICVLESDCPRGICRHAGWVGAPGRAIVCVPNRLVVEIRGTREKYDAETW